MKKIIILLIPLFFAGCGGNIKKSALNQAYDVEIVEAVGMSPITDNNIKLAKEASLSDSLKNALHLVVGVYVSGESMVSKSVLIDDEITSKTQGYIEKYEVLKEYIEDNFYKTKIKAYVRKEDIVNKLKSIENEVEKIGSPVVYINILDMDGNSINFASDAILSELKKDSFRVVDDINNSDITIDAKTSTKFNTSEGLGGFYSYSCLLTGNIKTRDGDMVGGFNASQGGIGINETDAKNNSILNCIRKVYPDIKNSIISFYNQKKTIKLEISSVNSMNDVLEIIKYLRNIPLIKTAVLKNYDNNMAKFEIIVHKGKAMDIATPISKKENIEVELVKDYFIKARINLKK